MYKFVKTLCHFIAKLTWTNYLNKIHTQKLYKCLYILCIYKTKTNILKYILCKQKKNTRA